MRGVVNEGFYCSIEQRQTNKQTYHTIPLRISASASLGGGVTTAHSSAMDFIFCRSDSYHVWFYRVFTSLLSTSDEFPTVVLQPNSDLGVDLALESTQCFFDVCDTLLSTYTESG